MYIKFIKSNKYKYYFRTLMPFLAHFRFFTPVILEQSSLRIAE